MLRHITRFDRENNETLYAYAQFIGEPAEYVLNQLVESVLAKDKEFVAWRAEHPESCVPPPARHAKKRKRSEMGSDRGRPGPVRHDAVSAPAAG